MTFSEGNYASPPPQILDEKNLSSGKLREATEKYYPTKGTLSAGGGEGFHKPQIY